MFSKCMPRQYSWKSKETNVSEGLSYAREWLKYASDITWKKGMRKIEMFEVAEDWD